MNWPRLKCWIFPALLVLSFSLSAIASQKQLASGHVPKAVAQEKIAPLGRLAGTNQMRLAIGLPLRNTAALTNLLRDIYDPASPQFHHYLTPAEFTVRFGPTPADYAAVLNFAETNGLAVVGTHPNRLLVDVTAKASNVERAFHVRLNTYRHPKENRNFFAPDSEPSVDASLPMLHVSGLDNFSTPQPHLHTQPLTARIKASPRIGSGPGNTYIGKDFRRAYLPGTQLTGAGQSVGLVQFDAFYTVDIDNYINLIGLTNPPQITVLPIDGGVASPGGGDDEVSLDIEMVLAMAPGVSNIYVYEAPNLTIYLDDILNQMADDDTANQLSTSWGGGGPNPTAEEIFQQMAMQGQSFFNASGDSDAFTDTIPFPSDSPNITQVGGTTLSTDNGGNYVSESVWNWDISRAPYFDGVGSSGGISPSVPLPSWQLGIDMTTNLGSTTMRNVPDVALSADNIFLAYNNGSAAAAGGTSCAAPLWAGFMALVNEQAMTAARSPVGFINPAVYAIGTGTNSNYTNCFHDIITNNNTWSASPTNFPAAPGYDLCTGWGTPAGQNLLNALAGLPEPLGILPDSSFSASGISGGFFAPASQTFTLTNYSVAPLNWSIINPSAWLDVSASNGTLAVAGQMSVTVSLDSIVSSLAPGNYSAVVSFSNQTSGIIQNHLFTLQAADPLELLTNGNLSITGRVGIPLTTTNFPLTLTNRSETNLTWSLNSTPSWLTVSPTGGVLNAHITVPVNLVLTDTTNPAIGNYLTSVSITNQTWNTVQTVALSLTVSPSIVLNGGFETGDFSGWTLVGDTLSGPNVYNAVEAGSHFLEVAHSGNYGAFLGQGGYLATLTQALPTTSNQLYQLAFWLSNPQAADPQQFIASWGGTQLVNFSDPPEFDWTNFQFLVTATGTNTALQFAAQNDANYFGLDDVTVMPVPPVVFGAVNFDGSNLQLNWNTCAGLDYQVQFTTNLAGANWQPLADIIASTNTCYVADTNIVSGDCQRFYRLVLMP